MYLNLPKLSRTCSVSRSSPCEPPVPICAMMMFSSSIVMYSSGFSPALRQMILPLGMCLPLQHHVIIVGDALSMYLVTVMSSTFTLPAPEPPPTCVLPVCVRPHDQD